MCEVQLINQFNCVVYQLEMEADEYYYGDESDRQDDEFYIWILNNIKRMSVKQEELTAPNGSVTRTVKKVLKR